MKALEQRVRSDRHIRNGSGGELRLRVGSGLCFATDN